MGDGKEVMETMATGARRMRAALLAVAAAGGLWGTVSLASPAGAEELPVLTAGLAVADPEGDVGSLIVEVPVTLSAPSVDTVSVDWATIDVPSNDRVAHPGTDLVAASGTLTFLPGETEQLVPIEVLGDTADEPPLVFGEWGLVQLSNPSFATVDTGGLFGFGVVVIVDDDPTPLITPGAATIPEGDSGQVVVDVPVTLSNPSAETITVDWSTFDTGGTGIATPGVDHLADSGTVTFDPGQTEATVPIVVLGDTVDEPPAILGEWALVAFSNASPNSTLDIGFFGLGIAVIVDDDTPPPGCLIVATHVATDLTQAECDALVALHGATGGPAWTNSAGWLTPSDPCTWYGVVCDPAPDPGVTELVLRGNQLSGSLPPELGDLTRLSELELDGNQLSGSIPAELGDLTELSDLVLYGNQLSGPIPAELGNLSDLTDLWLDHNQLSGPIPAELGNLTNLQFLWLHSNQLSGPIPPELGNLTNLTDLELDTNQLSGPIPPELGNLSSLVDLELYNNQLTGPIPPELGNLANLSDLELYNNQLTGPIPPELGDLADLTDLELDGNQLTGSIPAELGDLANLIDLKLEGNQMSGDITAAMTGLTDTLTSLILGDGPGGNDCFTATGGALQAWLTGLDSAWDECTGA